MTTSSWNARMPPAPTMVTGNQKHFPRFRKKTKVITSREFLDIVAPHLIP